MYSETAVSLGLGISAMVLAYMASTREDDTLKMILTMTCHGVLMALVNILSIQAHYDNQTQVRDMLVIVYYILGVLFTGRLIWFGWGYAYGLYEWLLDIFRIRHKHRGD